MQSSEAASSWFGPSRIDSWLEPPEDNHEFERLWRGFMTARVTLGVVLLVLQGTLLALGQASNQWLVLICGGYFVAALMVRLGSRPRRLGRTFDLQWATVIGVDVLAFTALQFLQDFSINYTPLFALPVLLASVLGSLLLAMGTAAGVTLLLLIHAFWMSLQTPGEVAPHFIQSALTGAGSFVIAFLAQQLSARLASEEQRARRSQYAARVQQQVNDLVIESLTDGILVVDGHGIVHAANPAARKMLQADERPILATPFNLDAEPGWESLAKLTHDVFSVLSTGQADVNIQHPGHGTRHIRVRTRMTTPQRGGTEGLCVMFLQDQREMEARLRTEKLASMGRMSAAVAHEIRNPLAAIAQANALLDEDITDPRHKRLTSMVQQNSRRLERIVDEVLNISRVGKRTVTFEPQALALNDAVERICRDWALQTGSDSILLVNLSKAQTEVDFEPEHLRRVLVNLLDNARRYASRKAESIQVSTVLSSSGQAVLGVWSDGPRMEPSVEQHLFEPFFSSESRSSGLGLYICRELCEGHGASISYQRSRRIVRDSPIGGNEFLVGLRRSRAESEDSAPSSRPFIPWH
jgi:two-component system sensor histidine kinase PilS (NtrC family)